MDPHINMSESGEIDCTGIVEHVINKISTENHNSIQTIQTQVNANAKSVGQLTNAVNSLVKAFSAQANSRRSHSGGHSTESSVRPSIPDGPLSIAASNRLRSSVASSIPSGASSHSEAEIEAHKPDDTGVVDPTQQFWEQALSAYDKPALSGLEVNSSMASASKIFWEKPMNEEVLKEKVSSGLIPANCPHLSTKQVNKEIWQIMPGSLRRKDVEIQNLQKMFCTTFSTVLQSASDVLDLNQDLIECKAAETADEKEQLLQSFNLTPALTKLQNALALAGKTNQLINQHRRENIKPNLPPQFKKLVDMAGEEAEHLFGDSISQNLEELSKDQKTRELLKEKSAISSKKRKFDSFTTRPQGSSNSVAFSKVPKRSDTGHCNKKPHYNKQHTSHQFQKPDKKQQQKQYNKDRRAHNN